MHFENSLSRLQFQDHFEKCNVALKFGISQINALFASNKYFYSEDLYVKVSFNSSFEPFH